MYINKLAQNFNLETNKEPDCKPAKMVNSSSVIKRLTNIAFRFIVRKEK